MISSSRQLKDLIRNMSKNKNTEAHILMRNYMLERFLERIALSKYKDNFILKGGMLVAAETEHKEKDKSRYVVFPYICFCHIVLNAYCINTIFKKSIVFIK